MLRRAGLIGDIHCESARLARALAHFHGLGVETLFAVGDIADGAGDLDETCALLQKAGVVAVAGNHDRWLLGGEMRDLPHATDIRDLSEATVDYLSGLPRTRTFRSRRGAVLLCHGLGHDDMGELNPDDTGYALESNTSLWALVESGETRFVINGHSHHVMCRTVEGLTVLNAGTLKPKHRSVCALADFEDGYMQVWDINEDAIVPAERWDF